MEIFGVDVLVLITDHADEITTGAIMVIIYQVYRLFNSIFKPVSYVRKLYELADHIVEHADDNLIDKIRIKSVKNKVQKEMKKVLLERKEKVNELIKKVSD